MSVWSRINGVAGNIRSNLGQLAAEVLEAVDEARASENDESDDDEVHQYDKRQPEAVSATPFPAGSSAVTSRLSALKARLEADRSRGAASPEDVRQKSNLNEGRITQVPASQSWTAGAQAQRQETSHPSADMSTSGHHGEGQNPQSINGSQPQDEPYQLHGFEEVMLSSPARQPQSSSDGFKNMSEKVPVPGDNVELLKAQIQRLKAELVSTSVAHEEAQEDLEKVHSEQIDAMTREMHGIKEQLEAKEERQQDTSSDDGVAHARIMELQVRIKELQAENARLSEISTSKIDSVPFSTATEAEFWTQNAEADSEVVQRLQMEVQALQEAMEAAKASAHAEIERESTSHAETRLLLSQSQAALQAAVSREQERAQSADRAHADLQHEIHQLQTALKSQQLQSQSALEAERSAHAGTKQQLAVLRKSMQGSSSLLESQLNEERMRHEQTSSELAEARQQLASVLRDAKSELQTEQQQCKQLQEDLERIRQELAGALRARTEADAALTAERGAREQAEQALQSPAIVEASSMVAQLQSQLQGEQHRRMQLETDANLLQQRCESLAQEREGLSTAAGRLQQVTAALSDAEARASTLEKEAATCKSEADQERVAVAELQKRLAESTAALQKEQKEREQLQRDLQSMARQLEETRAQHSSQASLGLKLLQEKLEHEQAAHRQSTAELDETRVGLQKAEEALEASASALADRDAFWKEELQHAQQDMQSYQAQVVELQKRCQAAEALSTNGDSSVAGLPKFNTSAPSEDVSSSHTVTQNPLFGEDGSPAKPMQLQAADDLAGEIAHLKELLAAAQDERNRAREQLKRLKQATMAEQEDEEDKMRWRIEAEVRLALEAAQQAQAQREAYYQRELACLKADLDFSKKQAQQFGEDIDAWKAAVAARDAEIQNLQAALGELAYSSEAVERLRTDLRASATKLRHAEEEIAAVRKEHAEADAARQTLEAELTAMRQEQQKRSEFEARLSEETLMLRRALAESMKRLKLAHSDADAMVDRRIVTKLLLTYFERGRGDQSVLNLMASMLGFTEEEKRKVGLAAKPGLLRTVAGAPLALVKGLAKGGDGVGTPSGTPTSSDASLANQWVDFLIQQAEAADAVEANDQGNVAGSQSVEPQLQPN
ncbi:probable Golgin candidate 4 at C-terminar half [Coccomyxa sp. Obi]|nr:probable Golgin candidate 4 at C-terminar half [Coccomyxa sp. Obi]